MPVHHTGIYAATFCPNQLDQLSGVYLTQYPRLPNLLQTGSYVRYYSLAANASEKERNPLWLMPYIHTLVSSVHKKYFCND